VHHKPVHSVDSADWLGHVRIARDLISLHYVSEMEARLLYLIWNAGQPFGDGRAKEKPVSVKPSYSTELGSCLCAMADQSLHSYGKIKVLLGEALQREKKKARQGSNFLPPFGICLDQLQRDIMLLETAQNRLTLELKKGCNCSGKQLRGINTTVRDEMERRIGIADTINKLDPVPVLSPASLYHLWPKTNSEVGHYSRAITATGKSGEQETEIIYQFLLNQFAFTNDIQ
jgi:hypothetical protein